MSYDFDHTVREWAYTMQKLNQQDLDRNFSLATTHLAKWMQAVRSPRAPTRPGGQRADASPAPGVRARLRASCRRGWTCRG